MRLAADHPLQLVAGLTVWAAWFVAVYGGLSLGCAWVPPDPAEGAATALNAALLGFSVLSCAALVAAAWACARAARRGTQHARRFVAAVSAALYGVAAVSTAVIALPLLALPPCV